MNNIVYVFGHKNPDTDSICAALAYADYKNHIDSDNEYIPIRLGPITTETAFALDHFHVIPPKLKNHLKTQVSDLIIPQNSYVEETDSIKRVFEKIVDEVGRTISVADQNGRLIGVVSISDVIPLYFKPIASDIFKGCKTSFNNIIEELDLTIVKGSIHQKTIKGNVYLYSDIPEDVTITKEDTIVFSGESVITPALLDSEAGYIIIGNVKGPLSIDITNPNAVVMTSPKPFAELIKCMYHAIPVSSIVTKDNLVYFTTYETIDDVKENMLSSAHTCFPVVNEEGLIQGTISRSNLVDVNHKKAILVDHNERGQSIDGIEDIQILEVIDHHRVADIQTMSPPYFRIQPVGCTCSIVASMYEESNIPIPKPIAGIMLSAIISDTLLFNSPTCTPTDKRLATKLAEIAGVDLFSFGRKLLENGAALEGETSQSIVNKDMKQFMFGSHKVMISQINTSDFKTFYKLFTDIREELDRKCEEEGFDLAILMVTDIVIGGTELIATGNSKWIAEEAFEMRKEDESVFLNKVFSRKKQVVPVLMKAARL